MTKKLQGDRKLRLKSVVSADATLPGFKEVVSRQRLLEYEKQKACKLFSCANKDPAQG
jgi:hypothetical protein